MNIQRFSVSMCVYGGDNAEYFDIAMQSVFNQTKKPDEVVLVVDGPVNTEIDNVITKYQKKFEELKVICSEKNIGHGNARRLGLENCSNDLVALMDADDISVEDRFEKQIKLFEQDENLSIVGGQIQEFVDSVDNVVGERIVPENDAQIKQYMKRRCPMNQMTVMFKKHDVELVGGYIDWYCDEDYYLWIRMALNNLKFANSSDILVQARVGKEMYQRRGGLRYFKSEAKLQRYMLKNGVIGLPRYSINVLQRLILQVLMPNKLRGWVFKKFARKTGE